jgi:hypothetical protein
MFKTIALSDIDIDHILKSQGINLNGIFMKDELPSKLKRGFYVINLQSSNIGNGTHWTVLYYNNRNSLYFDAFGFVPPVEVEQKLNRYTYNDKQIQNRGLIQLSRHPWLSDSDSPKTNHRTGGA